MTISRTGAVTAVLLGGLVFSGCGGNQQMDADTMAAKIKTEGARMAGEIQSKAFLEGNALLQAGKYDEARKVLARGREEAAKKYGPTSLHVGLIHMLEGDAAAHLRDFATAKTLYTRCRVILKKEEVDDSLAYPQILNRLARVLSVEGDHQQAATLNREALAVLSKLVGPEHTDVAQFRNELGVELSLIGRTGEAKEQYGKALATWERLHGKDDARVGKVLSNLSLVHSSTGKHADAERYLLRAMAIWTKLHGAQSEHVGRSLYGLGTATFHQKRYEDALAHFRKSLPMQEKTDGKDSPSLAANLYFQGASLVALGRKAKAVPLLERAATLRAKVADPRFDPKPATIEAALAQARGKAK